LTVVESLQRDILFDENQDVFMENVSSEKENTMTGRVKEILGWYGSDNPGTLTNLARLMNHGRLAGTGRMVILPVDQGFEHGPVRSFGMNPPAYDPRYHFALAVESGCSAYAAPLGFLEAGARDFAGDIPLILKVNDHDVTQNEKDPKQAITGSIKDALRLGCVGIGFTIYPGSSHRLEMYEQIRALSAEAKAYGMVVIIWSYPRGSEISKEGETAIDITGYATQIAAQLGAHIIKVKLPSAHIEQAEARKVFESQQIPVDTLKDRVTNIVQCAFNGRRITIFSGGTFDTEEAILEETRAIRDGGGFGSIIGRNSFQRPKADALRLLGGIMDIYAS
jgi:class I fructose-bisphosphate aldolase